MKKKFLSILLSVAMVVTMMPVLPMTASEAYADTGYGISNPRVNDGVSSTWDCVWFGKYKQTQNTEYAGAYYDEPIKWRVLHVDGDDAYLISDKILDRHEYYNKPGEKRTGWKESTLRKWLSKDFMNDAFEPKEQDAIIETTTLDDVKDYVFIAYADDLGKYYGFINDYKSWALEGTSRLATPTDYAASKGSGNSWWFHVEYEDIGQSLCITCFEDCDTYVSKAQNDTSIGVRPVLHLDLKSDVWQKAGTVTYTQSNKKTTAQQIDPAGGWDQYRKIENVPIKFNGNSLGQQSKQNFAFFKGGKGGITGNSDAAGKAKKVFPKDIILQVPIINAKVMTTDNHDGTYTVYAHAGMDGDFHDGVDSIESKWNNIKKNYKDTFNDMDGLSELTKMNGVGVLADPPVGKGTLTWYSLFFYKATVDENGKIISDTGGAIVGATASYSYDQQLWMTPIPIPFYIEFGASLNGEAEMDINNLLGDGAFNISGSVSVIPIIYLGVGVGIKGLASLGVRGTAKLPMQIMPYSKGDLDLWASIRYSLLFFIEGEVKLAEKVWNLWDLTPKQPSLVSKVAQSKSITPTKTSYSFADRDYQEKTTRWNGGRKLFATNKLGNSADAKLLQGYIMPNTIPQVNTVGDKKVMLFQQNDPEKTVANASVLSYSVLNNGSWSNPKAVVEDDTLDTYFDSKLIGDELYVAWQKCKSENNSTNPEDAMANAAKNSEIFVAKYNKGTEKFDEPVQLTNNEYLDGTPKLVDCNGKPGVVWTRVKSNSFVDIIGEKLIYSSIFDGEKWTTEENILKTEGSIGELTGLYKEGKMSVYYTIDNANSEGTLQYLCKNNDDGTQEIIETNIDYVASGLNVYDGKVNYVKEGNINILSDNNSVATADAVEANRIAANANRVKVGSKDAIIWMSNDNDGCVFYSSVKNGEGKYSSPVEIYRDENNTGTMFDAALNDDGSWDIIYTGQSAEKAEKTSMFYVNKKLANNVELEDVAIYTSELSADGQPIQYAVTNTGEQKINQLNLKVTQGEKILLNKQVTRSINPGETAVLEDKFNKPDSGKVKVQVSAVGQEDMTENELEKELIYNDFAVSVENYVNDEGKEIKGKSVDPDNEKVTFVATVKNIGKETSNASVSFYTDANATNLLEKKSLGSVAPGETKRVQFEYKLSDAVINADEENPAYPCSIKVDAGDDLNESDNTWSGTTYMWEFYKSTRKEIEKEIEDKEIHTHSLVKVEAMAATCKEKGNIEYYVCEDNDCGKLFSDENGNSEIIEQDTVIPETEHVLTRVYATSPTDTLEGNKQYWECSICGDKFEDKTAEEAVEEEKLVISAEGHKFSYYNDNNNDAKLNAYCASNSLCEYQENPLTLTLTVPDAKELVYNGDAKEVTYASGEAAAWKTATENDAPVIEYYLENGETKTNTTNSKAASDGAAPVKAGKYVAKVTVTDDYDSTVTIEKKFEITKANQPKTTVKMNGYTYEETPSTPSLSEGAKEEPTITYYYSTSSDASGGTEWKNINKTSLPAGTYYMYAVVDDNTNYNGYTTEKATEFTVAKANQPQTTVNMDGYKYNGTPSTPSLNKEVKENPDITYYYNTSSEASGGTEWKNINKTTLDAGTYYMYAVVKDNTNYNGYTTQTKQFKVANDDQLAPKTGEGYSLNKSILKITVKDGYEVSSSNENVEKIESGATLSDNAKYYIRKVAKKNYNASAWTSFTTKKLQNEPVELLTAKTSGKRAVKLSWNKVPGATKYVVYGQLCGKKIKKLKTLKGTSYTVKKIKGKKLKAHDTYKFYVVARKGLKKIATSHAIHIITAGTMSVYSNVKSIKAKDATKTLTVGDKYTVKATVKNYKGKKTLSKAHGNALRYASNNPYVASVNSKGVVTAKNEGEAIIYIQSVSGKYCKTVVTVEREN